MSWIDSLRREMDRAIDRVSASLVRRGLIGTAPSASYFFQVIGDDSSETFENVELQQHYGFTSRPPAGGECVLVCPGGEGVGGISVAEQDRAHRPSLASAGDVAIYGTKATGQPSVLLATAGKVTITAGGAAPGTIELDALGNITLTPGGALFVLAGGAGAVDFAIKGTTYNAAHSTVLGLISAYLTIVGAAFQAIGADAAFLAAFPVPAAACTAAGAAAAALATGGITAFLAASPTWTATKTKVM